MPQNPRYTKGELKGSGSFKSVYVAYDAQDGREVALNEVSLVGLDKSKRERIFREVQMLKSLHHKRILPIYDTWVTDTHLRFTTEMMSCSLNDFIRRAKRIKMKNVKKWSRQILSGLVYLHSKHIIHRDLKCENIFIDSSNSSVKIGDFGLSISVQDQKFAVSLIGTPSFLSPEVCLEESYNEKVDIWSFGMCVLEMLTGQYPYAEYKSPLHVIRAIMDRKLPQSFQTITDPLCRSFIQTCLQEASKRPTAEQLLEHNFFKENPEHDNITLNYPDEISSEDDVGVFGGYGGELGGEQKGNQGHQQSNQPRPSKAPLESPSHRISTPTPHTPSNRSLGKKHKKKTSSKATVVVESIKDDVAVLTLFINVKGQYKKIKINFNLESDTADQVSEDLKEYFSLEKRQKANIQQAIYDALAEIGGDFDESLNNNQQTHKLDEEYRIVSGGEQQRKNQSELNSGVSEGPSRKNAAGGEQQQHDTPPRTSAANVVHGGANTNTPQQQDAFHHLLERTPSSASPAYPPAHSPVPQTTRSPRHAQNQTPGTTSTQQKTSQFSTTNTPTTRHLVERRNSGSDLTSGAPIFALHTQDAEYISRSANDSTKEVNVAGITVPAPPIEHGPNHSYRGRILSKRDYLDRMHHLDMLHQKELDDISERIRLLKQQKRDLKARYMIDRSDLLNEFRNSHEDTEMMSEDGGPRSSSMNAHGADSNSSYASQHGVGIRPEQHHLYTFPGAPLQGIHSPANSPSARSHVSTNGGGVAFMSTPPQQNSQHDLNIFSSENGDNPPPAHLVQNSTDMTTSNSQGDMLDYNTGDSHQPTFSTPTHSTSIPDSGRPSNIRASVPSHTPQQHNLNLMDHSDLDSLFTPSTGENPSVRGGGATPEQQGLHHNAVTPSLTGGVVSNPNSISRTSTPAHVSTPSNTDNSQLPPRLSRSNSNSLLPPLTVQHITPGTPLSVDYSMPFTDFSSAVSVREIHARDLSSKNHHVEIVEENILDVMEFSSIPLSNNNNHTAAVALSSIQSLPSTLTPQPSATSKLMQSHGSAMATSAGGNNGAGQNTANKDANPTDLLSDLFDKSMQELITEHSVLQPSRAPKKGAGKGV
mmetsp:Transcript_2468/g.9300  ORF Transcript_2468/g.9300 Transcript_2468/m.9300 type:complete len:1096 (-) Transcript_2468:136-3423(-)|eukprot:CAMPEP_0117447696 /NCGR_PEP_ID=MMETSP0759-20121206/7012_1 /TAXON_ID=63605 /ORGANISM="Percolomonas cosmopolitus, Strain WS" /LENGTH=1095 /DNA_ID=CAMNT_0005240047 /DNA_START=702 /DNA_END=3989 /DNA_ORIENTATION=-